MRTGTQIFVLDVADEPTFAFEAEGVGTAEALARSPWFAFTVADFFAKRGKALTEEALTEKALTENGCFFARLATEAEASLYRTLADEFAEVTDRLLIAHLTDLSSN
jgi:hypothetical protein